MKLSYHQLLSTIFITALTLFWLMIPIRSWAKQADEKTVKMTNSQSSNKLLQRKEAEESDNTNDNDENTEETEPTPPSTPEPTQSPESQSEEDSEELEPTPEPVPSPVPVASPEPVPTPVPVATPSPVPVATPVPVTTPEPEATPMPSPSAVSSPSATPTPAVIKDSTPQNDPPPKAIGGIKPKSKVAFAPSRQTEEVAVAEVVKDIQQSSNEITTASIKPLPKKNESVLSQPTLQEMNQVGSVTLRKMLLIPENPSGQSIQSAHNYDNSVSKELNYALSALAFNFFLLAGMASKPEIVQQFLQQYQQLFNRL